MSVITLEQIDGYLTENKLCDSFPIEYDGFSVNVKTILTELEKKTFVERVVSNSYVNDITYSPIDSKTTYKVTFAQMFTDLPIPTNENDSETIDIDKLCLIIDGLSLIGKARFENKVLDGTLSELEICIKEEIGFKNQKILAVYSTPTSLDINETIENLSYTINQLPSGIEKVLSILDNIKNITKDGKSLAEFIKYVPKKKLDYFFERFQGIINNTMSTIKENATGDNIINFSNIVSKSKEDTE